LIIQLRDGEVEVPINGALNLMNVELDVRDRAMSIEMRAKEEISRQVAGDVCPIAPVEVR
jgi:hypothetical protein